MNLFFHTPDGKIEVDTATVTDAEWLSLNLTLDQLAEYRHADEIAIEKNDKSHLLLDAFQKWDKLSDAKKLEAVELAIFCILADRNLL